MVKFIKQHWPSVMLALLLLFIADGLKSYWLARHKVGHSAQGDVYCERMAYKGVWCFTFRYDGFHPGERVTYTIAPILPMVISEVSCR